MQQELAKYFFILALRLKQLYRLIKEAGIFLVVLALLLMAGVLLNGLTVLGQWQSIWPGLLIGTSILSLHFYRKDLPFLAQLSYRLPILLLLEYMLAASPFFLLFIAYHNSAALLGLASCILLCSLLPEIKIKPSSLFGHQQLSFIPLTFFEIRLGFRSKLPWVIGMASIGLASPWLLGLLPVLVFFYSVMLVSFFDHFEPKEQIEVALKKTFLSRKIFSNILFFQLTLSPYYLVFLLFHNSYWYFILLMMLYSSLWISFAIAFKYANYSPFRAKAYSSTIVSIFGIIALIPYLLPVNILLLVWYIFKANKNLKFNALNTL